MYGLHNGEFLLLVMAAQQLGLLGELNKTVTMMGNDFPVAKNHEDRGNPNIAQRNKSNTEAHWNTSCVLIIKQ